MAEQWKPFDESLGVWFVLEQSTIKGRHLHLHGEIVTGLDRKLVRAALRRAGGLWPAKERMRQAQLSNNPPDEGWIGYTAKDLTRNGNYPAGSPLSPFTIIRRFDGKPFARTQNVARTAEAIYEADTGRHLLFA